MSEGAFDQAVKVFRVYHRSTRLAPKTLEVYSSALILLRKWRERHARKAGITNDIHPHSLRHSFATDFLRETYNIRLVQKALGHADLATTQIYTHIVDEDLEEALKSFRQAEPAGV